MELLDIVNDEGIPTGEIIEREKAHELGILHRTSHVWILRMKNNQLQILLQKRSATKDSYPHCYDISSAGHIPAGVDFIASALRELHEELGYKAKAEELIYCGKRRFQFHAVFHGKDFYDNQLSHIYTLWLDQEADKFTLQKDEVEEVRWFNFDDCVKKVESNQIPHCIYLEELQIVKNAIEK